MRYRFQYASPQGILESLVVEADTAEQAVTASGIHPLRLIGKPRQLSESSLFDPALPLPDQITILAALGSAISAGKPAAEEFVALIETDKILKKKLPEVLSKTLTSDRLRICKFDGEAIMLAEVGERTSTLGLSISVAAEMMTEQYQVGRQMSKGITPQLMMIVMMLSALVGLPYAFSAIFEQLSQPDSSLKLDTNLVTTFVFGIKTVTDAAWWLLILALGGILVVRKRIWRFVKTGPVLSTLDEMHKCQRAVKFISTFVTLDNAGVSSIEMLTRLVGRQRGIERTIYEDMIGHLQTGIPLSESFDEEWFPSIMLRAVSGMESTERNSRRDMLLLLRRNLVTKVQVLSDKVILRFKLFGFAILFLVGICMIVGIYLPLMTINSIG